LSASGHGHVGVVKSFDPKTNQVEIEQGNTNAVYTESLGSIKKTYEIRHGQYPTDKDQSNPTAETNTQATGKGAWPKVANLPAPKGAAPAAESSKLAATATGFADGGIVTKPTHALIGEAGPEMVLPLKGLQGVPEALQQTQGIAGLGQRAGKSVLSSVLSSFKPLSDYASELYRGGSFHAADLVQALGPAAAGLAAGASGPALAGKATLGAAAHAVLSGGESAGALFSEVAGTQAVKSLLSTSAAAATGDPTSGIGGVLDKIASGGGSSGGAGASGHIVIDHRNAPAGVSASASGTIFKNVTMKRQTNMAPAASGPILVTAPRDVAH
jgi:hypothetical protein